MRGLAAAILTVIWGSMAQAGAEDVRAMIGFCAFDRAYALLQEVPEAGGRRAALAEELRQARNREVVVWQTFEAARAAFDMGRKAEEAEVWPDARFLYTDARRLFSEARATTGCERGVEAVDHALSVVDDYLKALAAKMP